MENLYLSGKCAAIGVCNFDEGYLKELLKFCRVKPMINQFERHPLFQQQKLVELCKNEDIQVMSYSPLARMDEELNKNQTLVKIAKKYGKSVNQIILRWNIDTGCIPIPASSSERHIQENIDVFDFRLTEGEVAEINSLECGKRIRFNPRTRFDEHQIRDFFVESLRIKYPFTAKVIDRIRKMLGMLKRTSMKLPSKMKKLFRPTRYSKKILIDNFGFKNRGDQLMIQSVIEQIRVHIPNAQICLRKNVFLQNPSYCLLNHIFPIQEQNPRSRKQSFREKLINYLMHDEYIVSPNEIDVVLDCCGYYINDVWHKSKESYEYVTHYFSMFDKPGIKIVYLPQAFGPFSNEWSQKIGKLAYERAVRIYAREEESYNYLKELVNDTSKLSIAPDFTCLLQAAEAPVVQIPSKQYVLVIPNSNMLNNTQADVSNRYCVFLKTIIDYLTEQGEQVYLLNHEGDIEEQLLVKVNSSLKKPIVILTKLSGVDIKGIIKNAKLVITARFHGAVSSLTQHVPTLVTSWSHKYAALLKEHECEQSMLDVTNVDKSLSVIKDALAYPQKYSSKNGSEDKIENAVKAMWIEIFNHILK